MYVCIYIYIYIYIYGGARGRHQGFYAGTSAYRIAFVLPVQTRDSRDRHSVVPFYVSNSFSAPRGVQWEGGAVDGGSII